MTPSAPDITASPCIGVCRLQAGSPLCAGCLRTVGEITEWRDARPERRREILAAAAARRSAGDAPKPRC